MKGDEPDLKKVLFRVPDGEGGANVETLWAESLGGDRYLLRNSPYFAYGVSEEDIVFAPFDVVEGFPTFSHVVERSGNRTIRILFDPPVEDGNTSDRLLQDLRGLGCTYEGANPSYVAITIPASVDLDRVRQLLIDRGATFEHADPSYADLFGED